MGIKERQERDREAVRRSILDAARELFVTEGFQNVSIRKIAERIEYSPAAIYGYFPSKDDIFFALAEEGFRLLGDPADLRHDPTLQDARPLERVRAVFWRLYEFSRDQPQYFALMFVERSVPRISREYERFAFAREMKQHIVEELQTCIDTGELPATLNPTVAMRSLTVGMLGVAVMRLAERLTPEEDADLLAADVLNVTLAGLRSGVTLQSPGFGCPLDTPAAADALSLQNSEEILMNRGTVHMLLAALLIATPLASGACSSGDAKGKEQPAAAAIAVAPTAAAEAPIARFIRATGTLMAEEQADVAAETGGRVIAAAIERGTPVSQGAELVRISATETDAQLKEAEANASQIEARLGFVPGTTFEVSAVPEVQNAKAAFELAQSEFARIKSLLDQRVVSQSEFEQRRTQMEAARQQYEAAKNGAAQQYQSLQAARARVALARKAHADTVVRAPFNGVVAQRLVSTGDYVTKGMKVAVVVRVNPLRVQLTIPEQFVSAVATGQPVTFEVDAYPGRLFEGRVKYVAPALQADQRALTIEASVPNPKAVLKPGLFATARIEQPARTPGVLVPAAAVLTSSGTSRVYVVNGDHVEERIVTTGETVGGLLEISKGLKAGERVATKNVAQLADGIKVS